MPKGMNPKNRKPKPNMTGAKPASMNTKKGGWKRGNTLKKKKK